MRHRNGSTRLWHQRSFVRVDPLRISLIKNYYFSRVWNGGNGWNTSVRSPCRRCMIVKYFSRESVISGLQYPAPTGAFGLFSLMPDMSNQCHDSDDDRRDMSRTFNHFNSCCLLRGLRRRLSELIDFSKIHLSSITFFPTHIFSEFADVKLMLERFVFLSHKWRYKDQLFQFFFETNTNRNVRIVENLEIKNSVT